MKKRIVALVLALVMVVSMIPTTAAATGFEKKNLWAESLFADIAPADWFYEVVREAYELGLMQGYEDGQFLPDGSITLAETITVAARIHSIYTTGKEDFPKTNPWYDTYVNYAIDQEIVDTVPAVYNRAATREEFAEILARSLPASALPEINTVDDGMIPDVADHDAIYMLYRAGILIGSDAKGTFRPQSTIDRSEVAAIVTRMALPQERQHITLTNQVSSDNVHRPTVDTEVDVSDDVLDENNALTVPYDQAYPDLFQSGDVNYSSEQILIKLESAPNSPQQYDLAKAGVAQLEEVMNLGNGVWYIARLNGDVNEVMEKVRELSFVQLAEYDYAYEAESIGDPEDIHEAVKGNSDHSHQWYLRSCGVQKGWKYMKKHSNDGKNEPGAGEGVVVAVIDTGVDYNHQDLKDNIWVNPGEVPDNGRDDDGNGYIDDYYGYNAVEGKGSGMDDQGHGTHVAGIIAAANNNLGVVGIAYNAKVMPVKAGTASGFFNQSNIAKAIIYAANNGADIINMSFGGSESSIAVQDALTYAYTRCVLVASAGNDGKPNEKTDYYLAKPTYPAALSYVLGVMSVDSNGVESSFTNWDVTPFNGVEYEVYAPGSEMLSTIPGNRYATWSGTSMAAPVVSAMAALLRNQYSDLNTYPSKFIYGQICGTGTPATCLNPEKHAVDGKPHAMANVVDVYDAMTQLPQPDLGLDSHALFDTQGLYGNDGNTGDGIIDAGETIAFGVTVRNRWGKSKDTTITVDALSQTGIADPYITIHNPTAALGEVGTYSTQDSGRVVENDQWVGWENPVYITVSPDCPNDYLFTLNVTIRGKNGVDESDTTVYESEAQVTLNVRNATILPNKFQQDTVLEGGRLYVVTNSTTIFEGVTVTVQPGARIQFWSDDENDPYAQDAIVYLKVAGELILNGTAEDPIELFPGERFDKYRVEIYENGNGCVKMYHTKVTNPYLDITYAESCEFTQNYLSGQYYYRYLSGGKVYDGSQPAKVCIDLARECAFYKVGGGEVEGSYEGCIFADCALKYSGGYNRIPVQFENCVFYGNNTYQDTDKGGTSAIELWSVNKLGFSSVKTVYNPETGKTYVSVFPKANTSLYANDMRTMQRFAEYLGGTLACINTQEEWDFLKKNLGMGNNNYVVGLTRDWETGTYRWLDGTEYNLDITNGIQPKHELFYISGSGIYSGESAYNLYFLLELPGEIYVQDILLSTDHLLLGTNKGAQIEAAPAPATAVDTLQYKSLDEGIVTVSDTGYVTPVSAGETTIVISSSDGVVSVELPVTVIQYVAMEAVELGDDVFVAVGQTHQLTPVLTPANTTEGLTFTSSNAAAATVSSAGLIQAVAPGTTVITAVCEDNGQVVDTITVTVGIPAQSITAEDHIYVTNAETAETVEVLGIRLSPADTTQTTLIWESSNPEIVDVDAGGRLIKNGTAGAAATLRATVKGTDLYTEVTVILSDRDAATTVLQLQRYGYYLGGGWNHNQMALLADGTLWIWGDHQAVPEKLPFEGIVQFAVGHYGSGTYLLLVDGDGTLNAYRKHDASLTWSLYNEAIGGKPVTGVVDVAGRITEVVRDAFFLYLLEDGSVWGFGYNGNGQLGVNNRTAYDSAVQMQLPAGIKIRDVEISSGYTASILLEDNGDLYYTGYSGSQNSLLPTLYATGVETIEQFGDDVMIRYADKVQPGLFGSMYFKKGNKLYIYGTTLWYLEDGKVYASGQNYYGWLGVGDLNNRDSYEQMKIITSAKALFQLGCTIYIQTTDGRFYGVGRNDENQIPNLTQGNQLVPSRIFFGLETMDEAPVFEGANMTEEAVLTEDKLLLDFDQGLLPGSNIAALILRDQDGNLLGLTKELKLDKLWLQPYAGFEHGKTYTLTIPANALTNHFNVPVDAMELTFTYSGPQTPAAYAKMKMMKSAPAAAAADPEKAPAENVRFEWTAELIRERWAEYMKTGESPVLRGNAILNRIDYTVDADVEKWLRISGASSTDYAQHPLAGNYWGTANPQLVEAQVLDYDDYQSLVDLNAVPFLTAAPENVWPFVVKAGLINADGEEVTTISNERVTFYVEFNRDMDTSIPLRVCFGSAYPYADYELDGDYVSARRWEGTTTLTTLIEGGMQCWSIENGSAADAPLKLYRDWGRFSFEIDNTAALALSLQGYATDEGVQLTWTQDDFDTLAGYNIYRADENENAYYQKLNTTVIPADTMEFFDETVEPGKIYHYKFTVVKTDLTESEPSGKIMIQSKDTMAPIMYHTPVYQAYEGRNVVVGASVTDNLSLQNVRLHYRVTGSEVWTVVEMANLNDQYTAVIGSQYVTTAGIEYYITASDGVSTVNRGSADAPYIIVVQEDPGELMLGDVDGNGRITVADALLVLRAANNKVILDQEQFARADLDGDEILSAAEALVILKYANGEIGSLQVF